MRFSPARFALVAAALLAVPACDAIFGITPGMPASSTTAAGGGTTGSMTSSQSAGTGGAATATATATATGTATTTGTATATGTGTGGGAPCPSPGAASCAAGVLSVCDGTGHAKAPITCAAPSLCDALGQRCNDFGRLSAGYLRACAIDDDQGVRCWGVNYGSPLGGGGSLLLGDQHYMFPAAVTIPGVKARQIGVADRFQCALQDNGDVACWGNDGNSTLGVQPQGSVLLVNPVPALPPAVEIGVAHACACARLANGDVDCWGVQDQGCLGTASTVTGGQWIPTQIPIGGQAVQLAVGSGDDNAPTCARLVNGHVVCWGPLNLPAEIPTITDALDVAISTHLVLIRTAAGLFWSTEVPPPAVDGGAPDGGVGAWTWSVPKPYKGFGPVTAMAGGYTFCAVQADGAVKCAATNGTFGSAPATPVTVTGVPAGTVAELTVGYPSRYQSALQCLRLAGVPFASSVYCWGDDYGGSLGIGGPEYLTTPEDVTGLPLGATSLTTGDSTTSVVLTDGSAWFWGNSGTYDGLTRAKPFALVDLGQDNVMLRSDDTAGEGYALKVGGAPVALFNHGLAEVGAQRLQTYASTGYVDARHAYSDLGLLPASAPMGAQVVVYTANPDGNQCGIFGDGTTTTAPGGQIKAVPGLLATQIAYPELGTCTHACAILPSGVLSCWGNNDYGQVGYAGMPPMNPAPSPVTKPTPIVLPGVTKPIVSVAVGGRLTCATDGIAGTGQVYCWGRNDYGQLGNGFTYDYFSPQPLPVTGIHNAVGVTAYDTMACAWLADKTVKCWGDNDFGQLGNGNFDTQTSPVTVTGVADVVQVSAGPDHACARHSTGAITCWGSSYSGQGGTGKSGDLPSPRMVKSLN